MPARVCTNLPYLEKAMPQRIHNPNSVIWMLDGQYYNAMAGRLVAGIKNGACLKRHIIERSVASITSPTSITYKPPPMEPPGLVVGSISTATVNSKQDGERVPHACQNSDAPMHHVHMSQPSSCSLQGRPKTEEFESDAIQYVGALHLPLADSESSRLGGPMIGEGAVFGPRRLAWRRRTWLQYKVRICRYGPRNRSK